MYYRSPIPYMGNKYKLLKHILPLFPKTCKTFIDLFGGSGTVSMNYQGTEKTLYNDFNTNIVELVKMFKENNPQELNAYWQAKILEYGLDSCSLKKEERENRSGYERRKENYNKLREDYNKSKERDYRDLFLLSCYSINHLIRFNTNSDFNASSGADSYNEKNYKCVCDMHKIFQNVEVRNEDALNFDFSLLDGNDFVYSDIPYLNTEAVYNEKRAFGGWSIESDYELFKILENLNAKGVKWGLSNVFSNRGKTNQHLIDWCEKNKWKVFHLERNYNPFSRGNSDNDEVYICNYEIEEKPTQIGMFDEE